MKKTFKSFLNEESEIDIWYQSDNIVWDEFLKQLKALAFSRVNYQLETELGFNPKIVIVSKPMKFWCYIYQTRQDFLEDNPLFSLSFSITKVKDFFETEIYKYCDFKNRNISIEELLQKFILVRTDNRERSY